MLWSFSDKTRLKNNYGDGGVMHWWECVRGRYECACVKRKKREEKKRGIWPAKGEGAICDCVVGNKWVGGGHMWV